MVHFVFETQFKFLKEKRFIAYLCSQVKPYRGFEMTVDYAQLQCHWEMIATLKIWQIY